MSADPAQPDPTRAPHVFDSAVLSDVQGLHGGQNVFVAKDGRCVIQVVEPGKRERRYELTLSVDEVAALSARLGAADFPTIETSNRPGVPDEARPTIAVRSGADTVTKSKWDNDRNARFDHVYGWFLELVKRTSELKPVYEGPFDYAWRPPVAP